MYFTVREVRLNNLPKKAQKETYLILSEQSEKIYIACMVPIAKVLDFSFFEIGKNSMLLTVTNSIQHCIRNLIKSRKRNKKIYELEINN